MNDEHSVSGRRDRVGPAAVGRARAFARRRVPPRRAGAEERAPDGATAVVVGGGLGGIAAATVLAERGVRVTVLEREAFLGGRAGAWSDRLGDGTPFEMERGFHAFFRQYYNLRALLRRVDPDLSFLVRLRDYPLLGPGGARESFADLARLPLLNVADLVRRTESLGLSDLPRVGVRSALAMLAFEPDRTYARWDGTSAAQYLDGLRFPPRARQMLFDVFSHSFFNPEDDLSAAELLMSFHFYFMGNPEGLVFDVMNDPFSVALWDPMRRYLEGLGVAFRMASPVERVEPGARHEVVLEGGERIASDAVVLAVTVPALRAIVQASPALGDATWRRNVGSLAVTRPFAVWRLWLDRPCAPERAVFAGTAGLGLIDNISVYDRFEGESRRWAERTGGSVVELHAYAIPEGPDDESIRRDLLSALHALYPETREARMLEDRWLVHDDCPSFAPGSRRARPGVETPTAGVALAGDFVRTEIPCALMERATTTGFQAASSLLARWGVREEPLWSVPPRGLLSALPL